MPLPILVIWGVAALFVPLYLFLLEYLSRRLSAIAPNKWAAIGKPSLFNPAKNKNFDLLMSKSQEIPELQGLTRSIKVAKLVGGSAVVLLFTTSLVYVVYTQFYGGYETPAAPIYQIEGQKSLTTLDVITLCAFFVFLFVMIAAFIVDHVVLKSLKNQYPDIYENLGQPGWGASIATSLRYRRFLKEAVSSNSTDSDFQRLALINRVLSRILHVLIFAWFALLIFKALLKQAGKL